MGQMSLPSSDPPPMEADVGENREGWTPAKVSSQGHAGSRGHIPLCSLPEHFYKKTFLQGWVFISIGRMFASHTQSPEFNPQHFINSGMVMHHQVEAEEREAQSYPWLWSLRPVWASTEDPDWNKLYTYKTERRKAVLPRLKGGSAGL